MSSKLSYKVSYYVLYAMFALILVVLGLFYFGGDATGGQHCQALIRKCGNRLIQMHCCI